MHTGAPMHTADDLFAAYTRSFETHREAELTLADYLQACRDEPMTYATATERLLAAIGEPEMVDTAKDPRLGRIFMNRTIRVYPAFAEFYGMEETIERIVGFFRHAAQGLEERKQILYLLGPVGGGKSSLAERLKALMENLPDLRAEGRQRAQPGVREPAGPVRPRHAWATLLEDRYGIPRRRLTGLMSPWCLKRLDEFGGDISRFRVRQACMPSRLRQIGDRQDRAGRREQPGHLLAGRQGRHPQAGDATRRTIPTPTATPAGSTAPTRACSNSSRCSRRRSRCCTRC